VVVIHVCPKTKPLYVCNVYIVSECICGPVLRHVFKIAKSDLLGLSCLFLCLSAWNNLAPSGWIFVKFGIWASVRFQVPFKSDITGILHEDLFTFMVTSHPFLLRMRNVLDKSCRENQNTFYVQ